MSRWSSKSDVLNVEALEEIFSEVKALSEAVTKVDDEIKSAVETLTKAIEEGAWKELQLPGVSSLFRDLADLLASREKLAGSKRAALELAAELILRFRELQLEEKKLEKDSGLDLSALLSAQSDQESEKPIKVLKD